MAEAARHRARLGGSGFTIVHWDSTPLTFARQVSDQAPTPVGPGTVPIHPMDEPHPVELMTAQAATMGAITIEVYDLFNARFWDRFPGLEGAIDIVDVFKRIAAKSEALTLTKYIRSVTNVGSSSATVPAATQDNTNNIYMYHNCVISQVIDSESTEVGTMEVLKQVVLNYTHVTRDGKSSRLASSIGNQR